MKFIIKSDVVKRVRGISGDFTDRAAYMVNADNREHARLKYEERCRQDVAHMGCESIRFNYIEVIEEIP